MSNPPPRSSRVFLVGCPRSGTTLLQCFLGAHPEIATFPETHFFIYLVGQWATRLCGAPRQDFLGRIGHQLSDWRTGLGITNPQGRAWVMRYLNENGWPDLIELFPPTGRSLSKQIDACCRILDALAAAQNRPMWLEKTPDHLGYVDVIERYASPAKFIHLVRNGADVVASLYDANRRYPQHWPARFDSVDKCIANWNHAVKQTGRHIAKPNHLLVHYEHLVADPPGVLAGACDFLGIGYSNAMVEGQRETAKRVVLDWEGWKAGAAAAVQNANGTKFHQLFSPDERRYILTNLVAVPWNAGDTNPSVTRPESVERRAEQYV